jgi:hypothetical protein
MTETCFAKPDTRRSTSSVTQQTLASRLPNRNLGQDAVMPMGIYLIRPHCRARWRTYLAAGCSSK